MGSQEPPCYTLVAGDLDSEHVTEADIRRDLENGKVPVKVEALKNAILGMLSGEKYPSLLMTVIRFVMPQDDHTLKKLLLVFWEIVPKYGSDGKLLHEMILVCDAYRKDLMHPNEYVRGSTLRFLCKLKEPELLEPLMPSIQECLTHRISYVRRNAVLAIYTIYKNFPDLIPDAPELVQNFLESEQDASCKRNAFMMLIAADQGRALDYLYSCIDQVGSFNEILQLVIVELVHKVCRTDVSQRSRFIRCIYNLLDKSSSGAVRYDAAGALLTLSSARTAVTAAASCYTDLILKEGDNNVKLIVLDRLIDLKRNPQHEQVLQGLVMDILRVVAAPDLDVRKKTLDLAMDLVCSRNVHEVVQFLKKELSKTESTDEFEKVSEYRQVLVRALHTLGVQYPDHAAEIVPPLMDYLSDESAAASAMDVILFVREAFEKLPELRADMMNKLLATLPQIKTPKVSRASLWILGEYAQSAIDIRETLSALKDCVGVLPIFDSEISEAAELETENDDEEAKPKQVTRTRITADGTYATESVYTAPAVRKTEEKPVLRQFILDGQFFVSTALANTLTKLALRFDEASEVSAPEKNKVRAEAMLLLASILRVGKSTVPSSTIDQDSFERIMTCLRVLSEPTPDVRRVFASSCHRAFADMLQSMKQHTDKALASLDTPAVNVHADDLITFRALREKEDEAEDEFELNLTKATGADFGATHANDSKLNKVFQLSGFSDPVYAEAYVNVHQYDILLDVLVLNQTGDTLQNLQLELATLGDLKLTEKPSAHTLGPHDFCTIKANVKVSSTETGIIFGNIVYDVSGAAAERNCVVLNDIHIDIMDYITPAFCSETDFRSMWETFEWENKVTVRTSITSLRGYLDHLLSTTNMRCLTPESALSGDCNFLAANLYARSVFGEDVLANLSIEVADKETVSGHIRIRSKTQGIALSLGDKITLNQGKDV
eukprot:m.94409 g.94409  ORF g.94409 m.94409 type:complete len:949 (+) comp15123_c1_seq1:4221-7067(+)